MLSLVLDASIAVKWLNPHETLADKASAMRVDYAKGLISLILPGFWNYEVANGINKAVARGHLSEQEYDKWKWGQICLWLLSRMKMGGGTKSGSEYFFIRDGCHLCGVTGA